MTFAGGERVAAALGVRVASSKPLGGGQIGSVHAVTLVNGSELVAKTSDGVPLTVEAFMLEYLRNHTNLPVPEVHFVDDDLLVMERLPGSTGSRPGVERHAAELLAELHAVEADRFGFERDTLIGPFAQPNAWDRDWPSFFGARRLKYMAAVAHERGQLPEVHLERIQEVQDALPRLLSHVPPPRLVHGDVWSGNVLTLNDQVTGFLDPAIYFADREVELAFIELFGTFGNGFFSVYEQLIGVHDGYREVRRDVYQLYPLLVHVAVFGRGYLGGLQDRLARVKAFIHG